MEKIKSRTFLIILAFALCCSASSCRIFKKKCDCPKWGMNLKNDSADFQNLASSTQHCPAELN